MTAWSLEQDDTGRSMVRHSALPRFTAFWTNGPANDAAPLELCWSDAGSGEDDRLYLYGIQWHDPAPEAEASEQLLRAAALYIDTWIARNI